jgi:deoxyribodipyrimidine photo-lyase
MKPYSKSLFLFRRDLRLSDNTGLNAALSQSEEVIPAFHFNSAQIDPHPYRSVPGLRFMLESLEAIDQQLQQYHSKLAVFQGSIEAMANDWTKRLNIKAVWVNRDYTPFSIKRDLALKKACIDQGIEFHSCNDLLLVEPEQALKKDRTPYTVFTPFYNNARTFPVAKPTPLASRTGKFSSVRQTPSLRSICKAICDSPSNPNHIAGGYLAANRLLAKISSYRHYESERDIPALEKTTGLSAHLKFGTCSPRNAYWTISEKLGANHPLVRQLYWRDFLTHVAFNFPKVFGHAFKDKYDSIPWENDPTKFESWQRGVTGFPIVDAGMRQLNATGLMHNRVRMVVASFLVKDLLVDWRWGERYFAQQLVDYDPCVNNGNWQWAASTGCDAQPYFRIFNPWRQQERFDPNCEYIKKWIPKLADLPAKAIHKWALSPSGAEYPSPIVDHRQASHRAKMLFEMRR